MTTRAGVSRRRFLAWAAVAAGAAGLGLTALRASGYEVAPEVARKLRFLRPWQLVVVNAVGARIVYPEQAEVGLFADGYLADLAAADQRDVQRLLGFVEHGAPLLTGRLLRFTALDAAAQDAVLRALELGASQRLRAGFGVLKAVAMMALYERDESFAPLGYSGPVVHWGRR